MDRAAPLDALRRDERDALRRLLIAATAAAGRSSDGAELERLVREAPIEVLPAAAELHRVAGSVLRGLRDAEAVPPGVHGHLTALRRHASLRHLLVTAELGRIGTAFDAAELSWVVMKGPVVAALLYGEPGDRTYADLDLLVHPRDFAQAMRILEDLGHQHVIHNWSLAEEMLAGQVGMTGAISVDLHWHLHYSRQDRRPFAIDPELMIERARRVVFSGVTAPTLDPGDTLLTLAFHAARSDGHRLIWLKDIERAVAVDRPDLDELVRRCRSFRCAPPVGVILARARALLDADIPDEILDALVPIALRTADRAVTAVSPSVQLHERSTINRWFTRSVRSSVIATLATLPSRAVRRVWRYVAPPAVNETDDPDEKQRYLDAVASSVQR